MWRFMILTLWRSIKGKKGVTYGDKLNIFGNLDSYVPRGGVIRNLQPLSWADSPRDRLVLRLSPLTGLVTCGEVLLLTLLLLLQVSSRQ